MPRRCLAVLVRAAGFLAFSGVLACAQAVEIGEVAVRSYIGQPLVADIELTGFSAEGGTVDARLAHPDVFQASNIGMHPALSSVRLSVMRRDGRQFLHITSIAPVQTQYVHLFLDLRDGARRSIRAASLPLTADPRPAPAATVVPASRPVEAAPAPQVAAAVPPKPLPKPAPKPSPAVVLAPAPAASCPKPRFTDDEILACATRDYKNAILSAQIVELEEKVKALQAALDSPSGTVARVKKAPPPIRTATAEQAPQQFPWLWVGAALAALLVAAAGAVVVFKRRATVKVVAPVKPKSNMMGRLKEALQRDKKSEVGADEEVAN